MSFGWSVGDLIKGAGIAWSIYESLGEGARSAKNEFAAFQAEFSLIKSALERLDNVSKNCPGGDLDLGKGYDRTLAQCAEFIVKHDALSREAKNRRFSFHEKILSVWDKVSWPLEREEAGQLRESLERYVQIGILKVTANTSDVTRQLARASEQARIDHLELLKAVKTMSVQVSSILRRCLPDGGPDETSLDVKYLARLQRRHLSSLLDPLPGLNAIPEEDAVSQSETQAALQRIQEITDRLGHLALRLDTIGRQPTPSPERVDPLKRSHTSDTVCSDMTIVAPVVDLLSQIGEEVREALDKVGYEHVSVLGQSPSGIHRSTGRSTKVLNNAAEDWDQFKDWLQFQLLHSLEVHPGHEDLVPATWGRPSPEPDTLPKTPPFAVSPPSDFLRHGVLSPPQIPMTHDISTPMSRTSSSESNYPRSPSSFSSVWERRSSEQSLPLTHHPVQVFFPDRHRPNHYLHRPVTCHAVVYLHPGTNDPELIEGTSLESGIKLTHSLNRERTCSSAETSLIPYIPHSNYSLRPLESPFCIQFKGSHRVKIEKSGGAPKKPHTSPIYVCHDKQDFNLFQSTLLRRNVVFYGDVTCIRSSGMGDHCSQETVRVLQDPLTRTMSIIYFASKHPTPNYIPKFVEHLVSEFSSPQKAGRRDVRLSIPRTRRDSFGILPRRSSIESSVTTFSGDSLASRASGISSMASDAGWRKERWLQFEFETERDSEAFITALQHQPQ
ncbi:uncharacterized protein BDV17DRAFT_288718 [Aspergillus undulatus]|uniref:uncharacterized protein n=1 Tax=Aspergillus undulatus TaxID=1810928 RepID=UPI003CCC970E